MNDKCFGCPFRLNWFCSDLSDEIPLFQVLPKCKIRFYMGRHRVKIIIKGSKKALIEHLESGFVGNKREGYKSVSLNERDVVPLRICYNNKIEVK